MLQNDSVQKYFLSVCIRFIHDGERENNYCYTWQKNIITTLKHLVKLSVGNVKTNDNTTLGCQMAES